MRAKWYANFYSLWKFMQISANFKFHTRYILKFWNSAVLLLSLYLPRLENLEKKIPLCILKSYVVYPRSNFQLSAQPAWVKRLTQASRPPTTNCICCSHVSVFCMNIKNTSRIIKLKKIIIKWERRTNSSDYFLHDEKHFIETFIFLQKNFAGLIL